MNVVGWAGISGEAAFGSPVLDVAARTDVGVRRKVNEDAFLAQGSVYVVADGMGGHDAGDVASATAMEAFRDVAEPGRKLVRDDVERAIVSAREAVDLVSQQTSRGAGCTLAGVLLIEHEGVPWWYVLNIGDSRVYRMGGSEMQQLTSDHSLQAELRAEGNAEAARTPRNVITRALGSDDSRHDAWLMPVQAGVRLLVCSDGLTTELDDDEIRAILTVGGRAETVADELVRRACEAGGRDNITVVVVDTVEAGAAAEIGGAVALDEEDELEDTREDTIEVTRPGRS